MSINKGVRRYDSDYHDCMNGSDDGLKEKVTAQFVKDGQFKITNAKGVIFNSSQTTANSEFQTLGPNYTSSLTNNYSCKNGYLIKGNYSHSNINVLEDNCDQIPQFS